MVVKPNDDEYKHVTGRLRVFGAKNKANGKGKKKATKKSSDGAGANVSEPKIDADTSDHGGWRCAKLNEDLKRHVLFELKPHQYLFAKDNGALVLGPKHGNGEGPSEEEQFVVLQIEEKFAFKSGFQKYFSINGTGTVIAMSEAVGAKEKWDVIFENGKASICGFNGKFMTLDDNETSLKCLKSSIKQQDAFHIRINHEIEKFIDDYERLPGNLKSLHELEQKNMNERQSSEKYKIKTSEEDLDSLKAGLESGKFHETLLDRRSKLKADRYCK